MFKHVACLVLSLTFFKNLIREHFFFLFVRSFFLSFFTTYGHNLIAAYLTRFITGWRCWPMVLTLLYIQTKGNVTNVKKKIRANGVGNGISILIVQYICREAHTFSQSGHRHCSVSIYFHLWKFCLHPALFLQNKSTHYPFQVRSRQFHVVGKDQ